jgi:iron complex outermembrane recepter protein
MKNTMIYGVGVALLGNLPGWAQSVATLPTVEVTAHRNAYGGSLSDMPGGVGVVTVLTAKDLAAGAPDRLEDVLQAAGLATADANSSFGLSPGLSMRGFTVNNQAATGLTSTRVLLNGHPDIAYRFARDMSTVESLEVMGGFDSTLVGVGSPGGTVQYQSKRPHGKPFTQVSSALGSDGLLRATVDAERDFGALQVRAVIASQRGQKTAEQVGTDRDNLLLSSAMATPLGQFQLDVEQQNNRAPYVFGTFYANGQFWYDRPYVSPQSTANRQYTRGALYWSHMLGAHTQLKAWVQQAHVQRDERLVGFWTVKNTSLLSGYYRELQATADQQDLGFSAVHDTRWWGLGHTVTAMLSRQTQYLDFSGPQSIAKYTIDIANPVWPVNLGVLALTPRTLLQSYTEQGIAVADKIQLTEQLEARLGVRQSSLHVDSANNSRTLLPVTDLNHFTHSEGLAWKLSPHDRVWLSRMNSFEPVAGQTRDLAYLPPQTAVQWETGWQRQRGTHDVALSVFDIVQKNVPGTDSTNRNYLIPVGQVRSQGLSVVANTAWQGLQWRINTAYQHVRVTTPVSATQGPLLPGVAAYSAGVRLSSFEKAQGLGAWVNPFGVARRPADDKGTLYAPGFVRWDAGLTYKQGAWQINASMENLFDLRYIQAISASDNAWQGARRRATVRFLVAM